MAAPRLLVLVTGDPVEPVRQQRGAFPELIRSATGDVWRGDWVTQDLRCETALLEPESCAGVIVTGSPESLVERTDWMERGLGYLRRLVEHNVPTLGICFGHQMLGEALGGRVAANPAGREIGTVAVTLTQDNVLLPTSDGVPAAPRLVNMTHVDSIVELPPGARVLGSTVLERHALVQFGTRAWGVQFHPEMDGSVIRQYIQQRAEIIESEGLSPQTLLSSCDEALDGRSVLPRFIEQVVLEFLRR